MQKKYILGIDLHGTLLNEDWIIEDQLVSELMSLLEYLQKHCKIYICTGNDLSFVNQYVPYSLRKIMSGYVLETGSVYSDGKTEIILIEKEKTVAVKELEKRLKKVEFDDALFFAKRLASISIFTKNRSCGADPYRLRDIVYKILAEAGLSELFRVTHSDVAVDIVIKEINKFTGIRNVDSSLPVIAVADSINDYEFIKKADLAFLPANSYPFESACQKSDMNIQPLEDISQKKINHSDPGGEEQISKTVYRANGSYTEGLVEILRVIKDMINDPEEYGLLNR